MTKKFFEWLLPAQIKLLQSVSARHAMPLEVMEDVARLAIAKSNFRARELELEQLPDNPTYLEEYLPVKWVDGFLSALEKFGDWSESRDKVAEILGEVVTDEEHAAFLKAPEIKALIEDSEEIN